jgi:hypothetical protein
VAGGVSGAASGGILGLVLALLTQQFGYLDFTNLVSALILLLLVIVVFAVIFGLLGRWMKGRAIRRAKLGAHSPSADEAPSPAAEEHTPQETGTPPAP